MLTAYKSAQAIHTAEDKPEWPFEGWVVRCSSAHSLFVVIKYAGAAYLLYLAYRLWTAPVAAVRDDETPPQESGLKLFLASLTLTLGNPKVMIFFLALLPSVIDLATLSLPAFLEVAGAICLILTSVLSIYACAALYTRAFERIGEISRTPAPLGTMSWISRAFTPT